MMNQQANQMAHMRRLREQAEQLERGSSYTGTARKEERALPLSEGSYQLQTTCVSGFTEDGTPAYIKTIPLPADLDPGAEAKELRRIADQVRIGMALGEHANHVELLDYREKDNVHQLYYSVAAGETVQRYVDGEKITVDDVLTITADVARGLAYAHDPNRDGTFKDPIIHGDVTPRNVIYDGQRARLIDHGASVLEVAVGGTYTTRLLTPGFGAPEVAAGEGTTRSDVFGLGMLLVYMVTGKKPTTFFDYRNELKRAELEAAIRLRTTNGGLIDLIDRCTQANPMDRPTAKDVVEYVTALQTGVAAEEGVATLISDVPSGLREEWIVPSIEATQFAGAILQGSQKIEQHSGYWIDITVKRPYNRDEDKIIVLQEYIEREPVSARDRTIIERVIEMIRKQTDNNNILNYLRTSIKENPETIFGHTRSQLAALYGASHAKATMGGYNLEGITWEKICDDSRLRTFVETVAPLGFTPDSIRWTFDSLYSNSIQKDYSSQNYDSEKCKQYLEKIKAGSLDDRVAALREKYLQNGAVTEALADKRFVALFMTLEDEGLESQKKGVEGSFSLALDEEKFGTGVPRGLEYDNGNGRFLHYVISVVEGLIVGGLAFAAYGAAVYALDLEPAIYIYSPEWDPKTGFELLSEYIIGHGMLGGVGIGLGVGGIVGGITDMISRWKTRNVYDGRIERVYNPNLVIDSVQDLLLTCKGVDGEKIREEIKSVGEATRKKLTPHHLAQTVKETLS